MFKKVKIKDIAFVNPTSFKLNDDEEVTFLPMSSVSEDGKIIKRFTKKYYEVKNGFTSFQENDVLIAKITPCFENFKGCKCTDLKNKRGFGSTEFHVLRAKNSILADYLFLITRTYRFRAKGKLNMTGSAGQKRVPVLFVKNYEFPLPPLPEQKAIASLLSLWDEAIEKTERLIEAKERRLKAIVQKLFNNNLSRWNHKKVRGIFKNYSSKNHQNEELLSVTQDKGVIPRAQLEGRVMSPAGTTSNYKLVEPGNFVISLRSFQGGIEYSNYRGIVSPAYTVLKNILPINSDFYKHFFKTNIFINKYLRIAIIGIRDGKQVSFPDFETVKIPYPSLDEQAKIGSILNYVQDEIKVLQELLEKYKTQKRGLMQKLLTGKWREKINE